MKIKYLFLISLLFGFYIAKAQNLDLSSEATDTIYLEIEEEIVDVKESLGTFPETDSYKNSFEWKQYILMRSIGWPFLGVGVAATVSGVFLAIILGELNGHDKAWPGAIVFGTGVAMTVTSIPLISCAYYYRNKAKKLKMDVGVASVGSPSFMPSKYNVPALNFCITF